MSNENGAEEEAVATSFLFLSRSLPFPSRSACFVSMSLSVSVPVCSPLSPPTFYVFPLLLLRVLHISWA